uniref:Uncharacterized protein n=2 Tax=Aegilops tauschii subsp. strangulata TaxID=200361 RepID=A0A453A373_AEGTS
MLNLHWHFLVYNVIFLRGRGIYGGVAFFFNSVLAEWRPREAMAYALALFLPPGLMPFGRQLFSFGMESPSSVFGRRWSGGGPVIPSGLVHGDGRTGSALELAFGPNCNLDSLYRVLLASFRDYVVVLFSFESWSELCTAAAGK